VPEKMSRFTTRRKRAAQFIIVIEFRAPSESEPRFFVTFSRSNWHGGPLINRNRLNWNHSVKASLFPIVRFPETYAPTAERRVNSAYLRRRINSLKNAFN